ncbi:MAG: DNA starvation/stationary phase protection protein Dps [Myxococcales bacterium]|jgi:starvation-inducible DNA-binding protein|nr:DNA starvation/stationary phase protection protein Dps [Myxococcales bacterium]MDH3842493.1 DNA starvation/stationary phase protection protein Dps [Myxococcales bacterium]
MRTYPTKNDLPESTRKPIIDLLNANLANAIDLSLQSKQAHWNVKGPDFIQLHELFDQVYAEATAWVDLIAERAVILGGVAEGPLKSVTQRTQLPAYGLDLSSGKEHVDALSRALSVFGKSIRAAIEASEKHGDADTADLFTEVSRGADKMLWFVEAHLQAEK